MNKARRVVANYLASHAMQRVCVAALELVLLNALVGGDILRWRRIGKTLIDMR